MTNLNLWTLIFAIITVWLTVIECETCSTNNEDVPTSLPSDADSKGQENVSSTIDIGNDILDTQPSDHMETIEITNVTEIINNETLSKEPMADDEGSGQVVSNVVQAMNSFGWRFLKAAYAENASSILLSPVSLYTILASVQSFARGPTAAELRKLTGLQDPRDFSEILKLYGDDETRNFTFKTASASYVNKNLVLPDKLRANMKEKFGVELLSKDESISSKELTTRINGFIEKNTNGEIKDFLKEVLDPKTVLLLLNAAYLKGTWVDPFDVNATKNEHFRNLDTSVGKVPMMHKDEEVRVHYNLRKGVMVAELPYNGNVSMFIAMPFPTTKLAISQILTEDLEHILNNMGRKPATISLPKFKISTQLDLLPILEGKLDIKTLFKPSDADLSGLAKGLYASGAKHSVVLEVKEDGTTAAGATVIGVESRKIGKDFRVNRPFLIVIKDKITGANLFYGAINKLETTTEFRSQRI